MRYFEKDLIIACVIAILVSLALRTALPYTTYCYGPSCVFDDDPSTATNYLKPAFCDCIAPTNSSEPFIRILSWFVGGLLAGNVYWLFKKRSDPQNREKVLGVMIIFCVLIIWMWLLASYYFNPLRLQAPN